MKTLYDQLKPHIKAALDENHEDYGNTIDHIFDKLQTLNRYSELTIDDLATELALTPKIVSQIINEGYSCNFFDFVNKFRVEEAKSLLSSRTNDKMTIQEVMYDAGFNSKSSFNTAFKKFTKLTPTQFKNNL